MVARTEGKAYEDKKGVVIYTTRPDVPNLSDDVVVLWQDSRSRSLEQIKIAWALMTEIAEWQGQDKESTYHEQQLIFSDKFMEVLQGRLFHLSSATMSEASMFITMLIEVIIQYGIPTKMPLYEMAEDVGQYVYACLVNRKCAVCGRKTELHHVDAVGMGYNRREICHIGMRCLPLCREHHMETHNIGTRAFEEKYHLVPVKIDERIAKIYKLKGEEKNV
jgi:hypothetical protein